MRAPALEQKASAAAQATAPLQPPSDKSLSPHTLVLPLEAALPHPRSAQVEDPPDVGGDTGAVTGAGTGAVTGAVTGGGTGAGTGAGIGTATGLVTGAGVGAGAGAGTGLDAGSETSAQQRAPSMTESAASQLGGVANLVLPGATI